jgi:hypothetical protein
MSSTKDVQQSGMDNWGNLKIPMYEQLSSRPDGDGWLATGNSTNVTYSSLIGIPISSLNTTYNTTVRLETSYWVLDCPILYQHSADTTSSPRLPGTDGTKAIDGWTVSISQSWGLSMEDPRPSGPREFDRNLTRRVINYIGYDDDSGKSSNETAATCYISTSYVEVKAICIAKNCSVTSIRP